MLPHILLASAWLQLAYAYSFDFASAPTQCQNLTINLTGSGKPPYNILIVAYGNPPPGDNEVRKIIDHDFDGTSTSFMMAWPANAQFVATVSDSTAFGSGGTTIGAAVQTSNDRSCLPTSVAPVFTFAIGATTPNVIDQCTPVELLWSTGATSPVTFYGIIPGGNSFSIDTSSGSFQSNGETAINWTPDVPKGTDIIIVAGDKNGRGTGGSSGIINVGDGDRGCLTGNYPSSTPGQPAGGQYPTAAASSSSKSSNNVGPIVGGVIGGLVFIIIILLGLVFYFWRRRRSQRRASIYEKPDLGDGPPDANGNLGNGDPHLNLPQGYEPTPFIVPSSGPRSETRTSHRGSTYDVSSSGAGQRLMAPSPSMGDRPLSVQSSSHPRSSTEYLDDGRTTTSGGDRKGHIPVLRPVNIIQHDDAGAVPESSGAAEEPETVELPPAYNNLRGAQS